MSSVLLPLPPSGLDSTNPPGLRFEDHRYELLFDDTTAETAFWTFRLPSDYGTSPSLKILFKATTATSGNFGVDVAVMAVTPGDAADTDTPSFDTANSANTAVPGTAGYLKELSVTLSTVDGMAAGDLVTISLARDTAVTGDAAGDIEVAAVSLEYTAA